MTSGADWQVIVVQSASAVGQLLLSMKIAVTLLLILVPQGFGIKMCYRPSNNPFLQYDGAAPPMQVQDPVISGDGLGGTQPPPPVVSQVPSQSNETITSPGEYDPSPSPQGSSTPMIPGDQPGASDPGQLEYLPNGRSGTGTTTRYWDCCKPSCGWAGNGVDKAGKNYITNPVTSCDAQKNPLTDMNTKSGCETGGTAHMCVDHAPVVVNDQLAYGFVAVKFSDDQWTFCCSCFELTFPSLGGKKMIVQVTNTGGMGGNNFDIAFPGGGLGDFDGCSNQFGEYNGGARWGGIGSREQCNDLKDPDMINGCLFRWGWMQGSDNPGVEYKEIKCPAQLVAKSGCDRMY